MAKIIPLFKKNWKVKYAQMDKISLLEVFAAWRAEPFSRGYSPDWVERGLALLPVLHDKAETPEMKAMCNSLLKGLLGD